MKARRTPIRWILGITALTLLLCSLLACGPAYESLQQESGNLPTPGLVPFPARFVDTGKLPLTLDSCLRGNA